MWQIEWTPVALREAERLDVRTRERVVLAVERLAETGEGDVRHLHGEYEGELRLRVGRWRVRFIYLQDENVLRILHVLARARAYRD